MAKEQTPGQRKQARLALTVTTGTQVLLSLVGAIAAVIAPEVAPHLGLGPERVGVFNGVVYLSAMLTGLVFTPWIGWLGPVRVTKFVLVTTGVGVVIASFGSSSGLCLLFAAVLLGAALSCPNPTFSAILGKYAPTESMGFYLSVRYAAGPAGVAITGLILPLGLNYVGWQASLWVVAVLCVLASLAVGRAVGLIDWRNNRMPTDLSPTSSLVAVLSLSHLRFLCLVALSYSMMQQGFLSFSVLILVRQGVPLSTAAGLLSLSQLVSFLARVVLGHASDDWSSHRLVLAAQGVAMGVACLSLAWLPTSPSIILAAVVMIATGTLTMSWVAVLFAQLMRILPLSKVSTCSTGVQVFTFGGSVVSPFLISALLENGISHAIIFTCLSGITAVTGTALSMHGPSREAERAIGESTEG